MRPVVERYERQPSAQQRTVGALRYLSPRSSPRTRSPTWPAPAAHGTSASRARGCVIVNGASSSRTGVAKGPVTNHAIIPAFSYTEEPLAAVAGRSSINLLALVIPSMALAGFGLSRIRRFPVLA